MDVTLQGSASPEAEPQTERIFATLPDLWPALAGGPWTDAARDRLLASWQRSQALALRGVAFDAASRDRLRANHLGFAIDIGAAAAQHRAHRTRYEVQLNIPALTARSHQRGTRWQQHQMCRAQWQQLQLIRERDRLRKQRKREHDRAVERELQTMLPQREKVAR